MTKKIRWAVGLLSLSAAAAFAQVQLPPAAAPQTPAIQTNVDEVLLDIIVRDKKGKPITDLKPEDLTVLDSGAKQKITGFRLVEGAEAISEQGARTAILDPLRQIRLVTLAFEDMGGNDQRQIARRAAIDLIKGEQGTNTFYSVVAISTQLHVLQPFTPDKEALRQAIERATRGLSSGQLRGDSDRIKGQLRDALRSATGQSDPSVAMQALNLPGPSGNQGPPGGVGAAGSAALNAKMVQVMLDMLRFDAAVSGDSSRLSIFALESLVRGLAPLPGRKSILYFTWGLQVPPYLDEPFKTLMSMANRGNVTFYTVDTNGVMTWSQNQSSNDALRQATSATAAQTTEKHAVTIDEVRAADTAETSMRQNAQQPLRELAEATGGFLIGDSNDLRGPLRHVNEEISSYYEVAYNPGIANYDGSFRKVKVEVDRKNVVVHARNGYFALPPDVRASGLQPFEVPLLKALSESKLPHDIDFRSDLLRFQSSAQGVRTSLVVEVPIKNLTFLQDNEKKLFNARVSLVALVKNAKGEVVEKFTRDMPLQGALDKQEAVKTGNFIYKELLTVPAGKYTLETAVVDRETNKISAARTEFEIGAPKGVGISNISLIRSFQPNAKDLDPNDPFQFQGGRVTPTLTPVVKAIQGAELSMFFVVYPDPANPAKPVVDLEYIKDGQVVGKGTLELPPADAQGRIPYIMSSAASAMPPGDYVIHATVRQGTSVAEDKTAVKVEM
jgi:VWFA-related protein